MVARMVYRKAALKAVRKANLMVALLVKNSVDW